MPALRRGPGRNTIIQPAPASQETLKTNLGLRKEKGAAIQDGAAILDEALTRMRKHARKSDVVTVEPGTVRARELCSVLQRHCSAPSGAMFGHSGAADPLACAGEPMSCLRTQIRTPGSTSDQPADASCRRAAPGPASPSGPTTWPRGSPGADRPGGQPRDVDRRCPARCWTSCGWARRRWSARVRLAEGAGTRPDLLQVTSRCRRPAATSQHRPMPQAFYNKAECISRLANRDRSRPVGHRVVLRVRAVRPGVPGLHGAGLLPKKRTG